MIEPGTIGILPNGGGGHNIVRVVRETPARVIVEIYRRGEWGNAYQRDKAGFSALPPGADLDRTAELLTSYAADRADSRRKAEERYTRRVSELGMP